MARISIYTTLIMNPKLPYKELSLLSGVLTAAVILGLFAMENGFTGQNATSGSSETYLHVSSMLKLLVQKIIVF